MRTTTLNGFGIGDIFDPIKDVLHDAFDTITHVGSATLPLLTATAGLFTGGPAGAIKGFQMGKQLYDAHNAEQQGEAAQKEYAKAAYMAEYLLSAGIDISGNDPQANALIDQLKADDYDYESDESQELIAAFIAQKQEQRKTTHLAMIGAGVIAAGGLLYYLSRRRR